MADNNNPIKYSDLVKPDSSFDDLIDRIKELDAVYGATADNIIKKAQNLKKALSGMSGATDAQRKSIREYTTDAERLLQIEEGVTATRKKLQKELQEISKTGKNSALRDEAEEAERAGEAYADYVEDVRQARMTSAELSATIDGIMAKDYEAFILRNKNGMISYATAVNEASGDMARLESAQNALNDMFVQGEISAEEYQAQIGRLQQVGQQTQAVFEKLSAARIPNAEGSDTLSQSFNELDERSKELTLDLVRLQTELAELKTDQKEVAAAYKEGSISEEEYVQRTAELTSAINAQKSAIKGTSDRLKLHTQLVTSAEGSYDKLSAQYSLNKNRLNGMSDATRSGTEEGRQLEAETKAIYEEMDRLQSVTGKHTLNVGNYAEAQVRLRTELRNNTEELARMKLAGEDGSAAYMALSKRTGELKDALNDAGREVKNMASDTSQLDTVMSAASAAGGGFAAYTGILELVGGESEDVEEAQRKLQAAIAITSGLQAVQNNLQKQSALMLGIGKVQTMALAKAEAYRRLIQIKGTTATVGATVAQKAFNIVAMANPYVLLAMALLSVVGALVLFASSSDKAAKKQQKINEAQKANLDYMEAEAAEMNRIGNERVTQLDRELSVAKSRDASLSETRKIEDEIMLERTRAHNKLVGFYGQEISELDANQKKLESLRETLLGLQIAKAQGDKTVYVDVDMDGKVEKTKIEDAIDAIQGQIDNTGRVVDIAVNLKTEGADLEAQRKIKAAQRLKEDRDFAQKELNILRKAEDTRIGLIENTYEREREQAKAANARAIADIQFQLKTESNLTSKARKALNGQITNLREQLRRDLWNISQQEAADLRSLQREAEDAEIALIKDSAERRRKELDAEYNRKVEDIQLQLATPGLNEEQTQLLLAQLESVYTAYNQKSKELNAEILADQLQRNEEGLQLRLEGIAEGSAEELALRLQLLQTQRARELVENSKLVESERQSEAAINAKYDKLEAQNRYNFDLAQFDQQQELSAALFELEEHSAAKSEKFQLEAEKKRWQKILELNKKYGNQMSAEQIALIEATIAGIDKKIEDAKKPNDLWDVLGFDLSEEKKEAINEALTYAYDQLQTFMDKRVELAERAVAAADKEVESAQKALDAEIEARNNGYANNVETAQKELDLAKKNQAKALKEQQKAQKAQEAIDTATQVSSLVTAVAKIWAATAVQPWLAASLTALMFASFIAAKIKAAQVTKANASESYGEGTVELLSGGSHQSGRDVDLGYTPDGRRRRAEGGEFFAVINKRNSRRYRHVVPNVIRSLNNGTFEQQYGRAFDINRTENTFNSGYESPDLRDLQDDVRAIRDQNKRRIYTDAAGNTVIVFRNSKRTIKKS